MAASLGIIVSLTQAAVGELCGALKIICDNGASYYLKHFFCTLYLTYITKTKAVRFPHPKTVIKDLSPESVGFFHPDHEWDQERPKTKEHLKIREDTLIFQGTHIRTESSLIVRLSRLHEGLCEVFIALQLNNSNILVLQNSIKLDLSDALSYYGCGLKLECLAPMRRWKLSFNGLMEDQNGEELHVKFSGIWTAGSHTVEHPLEAPVGIMSDSLSHLRPLELASQLDAIYKEQFSISQYGRLDLEVIVEENDPVEIHLWGSRINQSGVRQRRNEIHRFAHFRLGHRIHVVSSHIGNTILNLGSLYDPCTKAYAITAADVTSSQIAVSNKFETFRVQVGQMTLPSMSIFTKHPMVSDEFTLHKEDASLDGERGTVITLKIDMHERPTLPLPPEYEHAAIDGGKTVSKLVLSTDDEDCKRADLTGGKGSSLAVLTSISRQFNSFTVPTAVVLTTAAYDMFSKMREVQTAIQDLSATLRRDPKIAELKVACEACVGIIEKSIMPAEIVRELQTKMMVFGNLTERRFAIRSSAVGEDSEEMSAAGQMTTFLGIRGSDFVEILKSVAKCWASQFSFTAVNYKRQYGQMVASKMAVVVQEMVSSSISGVMFTCDPVTSSPKIITITANYGLGESVVSASAEPDTFKVRRSSSGRVELENVIIGKKKLLIEQDESGGTVEREVAEDDRKKVCMSDNMVKRLASIGHQVESCSTTARDIEWAFVDERIFLLQSRPVTSVTKETDFEIINDNNGNIKSEDEILSRALMEEILPGALSPLGAQLTSAIFGVLAREYLSSSRPPDEFESSLYPGANVPMARKFMFLPESERDFSNPIQRAMMYASYGKDISDEDPIKVGARRKTNRPRSCIFKFNQMLRLIEYFLPTRVFEEAAQRSKNFKVYQNENLTAHQQLLYIVKSVLQMGGSLSSKSRDFLYCLRLEYVCSLSAFAEKVDLHAQFCTTLFRGFIGTSISNAFVVNTLSKANNGEIDDKILMITAQLLQAGDIESVDVPLSLQRLGAGLSKSPDREKFIAMKPEEALKWLSESESTDGKRFREFLQKHGHRCVKEFDVAAEPWIMRPLKLIKSLQVAARVVHEPKARADTEYDLNELGLELSLPQRLLLRFLVPRARQAVVNREIAKSALIRSIHQIRIALNFLADLMVEEGRLPERELLLFLELDEIHQLIKTRNPSLVARAVRRRRLHSRMDNEQYPVLQYGFPQKKESMIFSDTSMELKGTPVCRGVIEGRARVIRHFETEAHLIEKNEILITTATDTGWTPYFPILGGVVTEVGGLVSHGAVVAREYGLPCVVGIENSTQIFSSGDMVRLDGGRGTLVKVT
ncbi:uncharacterized protein LOC100899715 [Galendromus occidentalis]|uniref:Uncharacterized protein LOC100899715 n=1 Tax=Galendromus occidentalis TaxID=34638 RepID=A0AAJ6VZA8_9ACAR|nr:uncharacterized protein LOC100899715 [Galendromus occidentalis]